MNEIPDDILIKAGTQMIVEAFKSSLTGLQAFTQWIGEKTHEYDPLRISARKYAESFERRFNTVRVLAMDRPVPLRDICVRVNILDKIPSRTSAPLGDLYRSFVTHGFRLRQIRKTQDALSAINELGNLIILGAPGAGKTTFLKHLGLKALDRGLKRLLIPVFVSLKDWSDSGQTLFEHLVEQFGLCDFPDATLFVERALKHGKLLLLLDGFDEVSGKVDATIYEIKTFVDKYHANQFVLSCRTAAYQYVFERFSDVEIADFDDDQIQSFIANWFRGEQTKGAECWRILNDKTNARIRELGTSPLLLTMLCLVFSDTLTFPSNRSELYKEGIDILFKKWDSSRGIKRHEVYRDLSLKKKEILLSQIAYRAFANREFLIAERTLLQYVMDFCRNLPRLEGSDMLVDASVVVKAIEMQHGILVECAKGIYSFSHLTFQEYFAARYLVDNEAGGELSRTIEAHLLDNEWREVVLLSAGMMANADKVVFLIRQRVGAIGKGEALSRWLKALDEMVFEECYCVPLTKAFLLGHLFRQSGKLASLADAIAEGLYKQLNTREREKVMLDMDKEVANLRAMEWKRTGAVEKMRLEMGVDQSFETYLQGTDLIVSYLNADCYLSRAMRRGIGKGLLSEPFIGMSEAYHDVIIAPPIMEERDGLTSGSV